MSNSKRSKMANLPHLSDGIATHLASQIHSKEARCDGLTLDSDFRHPMLLMAVACAACKRDERMDLAIPSITGSDVRVNCRVPLVLDE